MTYKKNLVGATVLLVLVFTASGCTMIDRLKARDNLNRGVTAYKSKEYPQATEYFKEAIRLDPELENAYLYLAATYRAQFVPHSRSPENVARADQAITVFEEVLRLNPRSTNAMANIATIYGGLDEHDKAKDWHRKRMEVEPDNPEPLYGIGTIDWQLSHAKTGTNGENVPNLTEEERLETERLVDDGMTALQKALEIRPDYADALTYLNLLYREKAYLSAETEERRNWLREADRLALRALEVRRKQEEELERQRRMLKVAPTSG
jgi:tetratricopeptide (TPR) repeat protein